jgi:hypothetical protein
LQHFGFFFCKREPGMVTVKVDGVITEFNVLHVLEFTRCVDSEASKPASTGVAS